MTGNELSITNHEVHGFSNSFQHINNKKTPANWLAKYIFDYNSREEALEKCFWQNHKDNYSASCKPKNSTSMKQIFCQLQNVLLLRCFRLFSENKIFSWLRYFSILKKLKICLKFHKNYISCFWEKVVLINWLTTWQWCFHMTLFCLKTRVQ